MIITSQKALNLIANHAILQAVPELLGAVEAYRAADRQWTTKKDCKTCEKAKYFGPVEIAALNAIKSLPPEAVERLKKFTGEKEIYLNLPNPGKPGSIMRLDKKP